MKVLLALLLFSVPALAGEKLRGPGIVSDPLGNPVGSYTTADQGDSLTVNLGNPASATFFPSTGRYYGPGAVYTATCIEHIGDRCFRWQVDIWLFDGSHWYKIDTTFEADVP